MSDEPRTREALRMALRPRVKVGPTEADEILGEILAHVPVINRGETAGKIWETRAIHEKIAEDGLYAIKDADFEWVERMVQAIVAACAATPAAGIAPLVGLLYKYRTKGVDLTAEQGAVLRALVYLKRSATLDEIVQVCAIPLTREALVQALADLHAARTRKGEPANIVAEEGGRWRSVGI